jgi:arylsulfatase A-like enzyme
VKLEAKARRQLDRMPDKCAVTVLQDLSGVLAPAVGAQCAAATGSAGSAIDAAALRDCLATLLAVWVDRWGPSPQPLRPNIVFILTDDQRWDTTDATHALDGVTDVMARTRAELAGQGVELTEAFMTTPLCCPSRSSILSGQYAHRTGVYKNGGNNGGADDFDDTSTLATWLQGAGYRTSMIGKYLNGYAQLWDDATEPPYVPPGWSEWRGMKNVAFFDYVMIEPDGLGGYVENAYGNADADYSTDVLREKAKTFISDAVGAGDPFFLYLAFKAPHLPQIPAPRHDGLFAGLSAWRPPSYNEADLSDKPSWMQSLPPQNSADLDQIRADQLEMLQAVDEAIGGSTAFGITGIMEHLRNLGVADDTIVVFFADNGWLWGEHRLRAKNQPYEESIRAPMMVRYPKLAPLPRVETRFALNIDLAPTFAELVGAGIPLFQDGASLVRVLDGTEPAGSWRTDFLAEAWPGSHPWALIRNGQWKYTEIALDPGNPATAFDVELYDLVADPYEETNVATANPARVATMATRLRQLRPNWPVDADPNGPDPAEDE